MPPLNRWIYTESQGNDAIIADSTFPLCNDGAAQGSNMHCAALAPSISTTATATGHNLVAGKKRVRFSEDSSYSIISRKDYTAQERKNCWYAKTDFTKFKQDVVTTAYLVQTNPSCVDGFLYTKRGSENRLPDVIQRRNRIRALAKAAVVDEQDEPYVDCHRIASFYQHLSMPAVYEAIQMAAIDRFDAHAYQMEYCSPPVVSAQDTSQQDFFGDNWIRSISGSSSVTPSLLDQSRSIEDNLLDRASGFDDSWLRDAVMA